ncbi:MAG: hypothetical protein AMXMBFR64_02780 [Myxococcales bacterium]
MAALPCGLYRTTLPLTEREEQVPAGRLVYFHNHSSEGPPLVLLPRVNTDNRWTFHDRGYLVRDADWTVTLVALPSEGFYILRGHFHPPGGPVVHERTLLQLGYNLAGDPILFIPKLEDNAIRFPSVGYRFETLDILKDLDPAPFVLPRPVAAPEDDHGPLLH